MTIQKVTVVAVNGHQGPYGTPYSQFCTDASLHVLTENDPSNILILQSDGQEGFDHLMKNSKTHLFDYVIEVNIDHITHGSPSGIVPPKSTHSNFRSIIISSQPTTAESMTLTGPHNHLFSIAMVPENKTFTWLAIQTIPGSSNEKVAMTSDDEKSILEFSAMAIISGTAIKIKVSLWSPDLRVLIATAIRGSTPVNLVVNKAFRNHDFLNNHQVAISTHTALCFAGLSISDEMNRIISA